MLSGSIKLNILSGSFSKCCISTRFEFSSIMATLGMYDLIFGAEGALAKVPLMANCFIKLTTWTSISPYGISFTRQNKWCISSKLSTSSISLSRSKITVLSVSCFPTCDCHIVSSYSTPNLPWLYIDLIRSTERFISSLWAPSPNSSSIMLLLSIHVTKNSVVIHRVVSS